MMITEKELVFDLRDYYYTGRYALEYTDSPQHEILAKLTLWGVSIELSVQGEAVIEYDGKEFVYDCELHVALQDEINELIGKNSKKVKVIKSPSYYISIRHGNGNRRVWEKVNFKRLPTPLKAKALLFDYLAKALKRVDKSTLNSEALEQFDVMYARVSSQQSIQMLLKSSVRLSTAKNNMLDFLNESQILNQYASKLELDYEKDFHGKKWMSIALVTDNEKIMPYLKEKMLPYGEEFY